MKRSEIGEEIRYVWDCPKCGHFNEQDGDPDDYGCVICEGCGEGFEIEDDE